MAGGIGVLLLEAQALEAQSFLRNHNSVGTQTLSSLKSLYDYTKLQENLCPQPKASGFKKKKRNAQSQISKTEEALTELVTETFDSGQIWEELQLQNGIVYENLVTSISQLLLVSKLAYKRTQLSPQALESEQEKFRGDHSDSDIASDEDHIFSEHTESDQDEPNTEQEEKSDVEFRKDKVDENGELQKFENESQRILDLGRTSKLSNFEKQNKKIEGNIILVEKTTLEPKNWKYQGEVTGEKRPENSLLEEHLIFDHLLKQAPEITAKTTLKLEDIIKNRIKDGAWDDVIRKAKPQDNPNEYKRLLVMNQEKSKLSLAQIYEQEYIESQRKADDKAATRSSWSGGLEVEDSTKPPEDELKISKDLKSLFSKLDSLSNFHYTPKLPSAEIKIVTNIPSINMEEVAPISTSDATLLAPKEIQDPVKGEVKSKSERTTTDKLRERRLKKKKQHLKRLAREEKARNSGFGLRNIKVADSIVGESRKNQTVMSKDEGLAGGKELKSSKAFFHQLQEETQTLIKETLLGKRGSQKKKDSQLSAKKFKL